MKPVSVLLQEIAASELAQLPDGWSVIVYDTLYGTDPIPRDKKRYVLLLHKLPPLPTASAGT